ncbi:SDR family oxidoreductase [Nonomuraea dietziae]|uniref:SDR family oxidoreductase n=1 Tax=Nonomuraea dietziae TaxID=65515 RepID=UPI003422780B
MNETILVTGATGHTGGQVVRQLHERGGVTVKALSRDPGRVTFPEGVRAVKGDLSDPGSLDEALEGVDRIFLVWPTMFTEHSRNAVIPKLAAQARRIVYLSAAGAETHADPDNASHNRIERLIREHAKEWTFLRSGGHMSNDLATPVPADGVVRGPFLSWARSQIHPKDLAAGERTCRGAVPAGGRRPLRRTVHRRLHDRCLHGARRADRQRGEVFLSTAPTHPPDARPPRAPAG